MANFKKTPTLHIVTAVVTIILLMAFTVFSVGIFAEDKTHRFPESQEQQVEVVLPEIHYFETLEDIHSFEENKEDFYIVVFDVGTTGTRAHVFHFGRSENDKRPVLLSDNVFETSETLTNTIEDPKTSAEQCFSRLITDITTSLPKSSHASTQVLLKATESLRQLPKMDRRNLLHAAYNYLHGSPFLVSSYDDTFGILDSHKEGVYQWITINYVNGVFESSNLSQATFGVVGIGGGSVQMAFYPTDSETLKETSLSKQLRTVNLYQQSLQLYTHSYSGLGRAESRVGILQTEQRLREGSLQKSDLSQAATDVLGSIQYNTGKNLDTLYSVCFPPGYEGTFSLDETTYNIAATPLRRPHIIYEICTIIVNVFLDTAEDKPTKHFAETQTQEFYVLENKLRHLVKMDDDSDGTISLEEIDNAAQQVCKSPNASEPFACLDLIYTYTILHHGFGFPTDKVVHIDTPTRLDGALSWALGFAIDWLQNQPSVQHNA